VVFRKAAADATYSDISPVNVTNLWLQSGAAQTLDPYPVLDPCGSAVSTGERVLAP
jgi:hypothetical protein